MAKETLNSYELSRIWFDWCFENPEKITPNHSALYFFCIEHCNRLGWKKKFGLPTTMAKEAIGIKSYNTYIKTLTDLTAWGFVTMVEKSKNQYSANIIALSKFDKAPNKALDKALIKHGTKHMTKQGESTVQSIDSITKQDNNITNKQNNHKQEIPPLEEFLEYAEKNLGMEYPNYKRGVELKYKAWVENGWKTGKGQKIQKWKSTLLNTIPFIKPEKHYGEKEKKSDPIVKGLTAYERVQNEYRNAANNQQ